MFVVACGLLLLVPFLLDVCCFAVVWLVALFNDSAFGSWLVFVVILLY